MARIVIAGSGFGGLIAAVRLRRHLKNLPHSITVVAKDTRFLYRPSLVGVAFGETELKNITFDLAPAYQRLGIEFRAATVSGIDPLSRTVATSAGDVAYDKLVVALGERLAPEEVPGLAEYGYSVCNGEEALRLRAALEQFKGGPAVVGFAQNVQTGGPAFEVALALQGRMARLQQSGSIQFVDPLPRMWAPAGPEAGEFMVRTFAERGITRRGPVTIKRVEADRVVLGDDTELESGLTILLPPFRGHEAQKALAGDNPRGWIETARTMRSTAYPDVFVAGSSVAFEGPKQGHTAMLQAEVAAYNIARDLGAVSGPEREYVHEMSCVLDLGGGEGLFVRRSLWNEEVREASLGRTWPLAKEALAYAFVNTPLFKEWGISAHGLRLPRWLQGTDLISRS